MRTKFAKRGRRLPESALLGVLVLALVLLPPAAEPPPAAAKAAKPKLSRSPGCHKRSLAKRRQRRCPKAAAATESAPLRGAAIAPHGTPVPPPASDAGAPSGPALGESSPSTPPLPDRPPASVPPTDPPPVTTPPQDPPPPPLVPAAARLFALDSVWSAPLPASTPVDPESAVLVANLTAKIASEVEAGAGPRLGGDSRAALYRVGPAQPRVPVFLDTGFWGDQLAARFAAGVPIPADAQPVLGKRSLAGRLAARDRLLLGVLQAAAGAARPPLMRAPKVTAGCALPAGDYVYVVTSVNANGESTVDGKGVGARVDADGGCVTIRWGPISGADGYRIYRGLKGAAASYLSTVPADVPASLRDDGLTVPAEGSPPKTNTAATPGEWHAAFGGLISGISESPGYYRDRVGPAGEVLEQSNWGSAATGMPLVGGLITKEDVQRGSIDHAVSIGLDNSGADAILRAGQFAFPAQRADGLSTRPDSIPEGARLILDPTLDLDSLRLSPLAGMLAEAAQRYGLIVEDGSLSTLIYAEDPAPEMRMGLPNFYRPLVGRSSTQALLSFPWQSLEVVQMQLCVTRPCLPPSSSSP